MLGLTLEEIANKLGYKTHTGVLKRIHKIGRYSNNKTQSAKV